MGNYWEKISDGSESISDGSGEPIEKLCGRRKATDELRQAASRLERKAAGLRNLAAALDEIERHAASGPADQEGGPHIGAGSQAEISLWELAQEIR